MMNCRLASEAMHAALDAGQSGRLPGAVQAHLADCAACRHAWAEATALEARLNEVANSNVPLPSPGLHARIMAAVREEQARMTTARHARRIFSPRRMLASAAALLLVLGAGVILNRQPSLKTGHSEDTPRVEVPDAAAASDDLIQIDLTQWVGNPKQDLKELASAILATTSGVIDVGALDQTDQAAAPQATPEI